MNNKVVIDGSSDITIEQIADCSVETTENVSVEVNVVLDGTGHLDIDTVVDTVLSLDCDGEYGIVTVTEGGDYPHYVGQTVVIPKANSETILQTQNKSLDSDITVRKIPYYETSNESGTT